MAGIIAVNIIEKKGEMTHPIEKGLFKEGYGLVGDAHAGKGNRQVSLFESESIEKIRNVGVKGLCYGNFAENLTTEGIALHRLPVGSRLKIGEAIIEITQVGKECYLDCAIREQGDECVLQREVVFAKVLTGGYIKPGDGIEVLKN